MADRIVPDILPNHDLKLILTLILILILSRILFIIEYKYEIRNVMEIE